PVLVDHHEGSPGHQHAQENDSMAASATTPPTRTKRLRPSSAVLGDYSLLLGAVTSVPQLCYALFALDREVFPLALEANFLGALWYNYILSGYQRRNLSVDAGMLTDALEDLFKISSCSHRSTSPLAWACCIRTPGSTPLASSPERWDSARSCTVSLAT